MLGREVQFDFPPSPPLSGNITDIPYNQFPSLFEKTHPSFFFKHACAKLFVLNIPKKSIGHTFVSFFKLFYTNHNCRQTTISQHSVRNVRAMPHPAPHVYIHSKCHRLHILEPWNVEASEPVAHPLPFSSL